MARTHSFFRRYRGCLLREAPRRSTVSWKSLAVLLRIWRRLLLLSPSSDPPRFRRQRDIAVEAPANPPQGEVRAHLVEPKSRFISLVYEWRSGRPHREPLHLRLTPRAAFC